MAILDRSCLQMQKEEIEYIIRYFKWKCWDYPWFPIEIKKLEDRLIEINTEIQNKKKNEEK